MTNNKQFFFIKTLNSYLIIFLFFYNDMYVLQ